MNNHFCPTCDRSFKNLAALKSHVRGHDGTAQVIANNRVRGVYSCALCPKVMGTPIGLSNHMRSHTGQSATVGGKIAETRRRLGLSKGDRNPNYGVKDRPWMEGDKHPLRRWHRENPGFGNNQRGDNNPVHKVKHRYDDPEYKGRVIRGLLAHVDERRGSTYTEVYGEEKAEEIKDKLRKASPARMSKFARRETEPERIVREMLTDLRVVFDVQVAIGHYTVDFLIPDFHLVIQADGDYWHAHPDLYTESVLTATQRKSRRLDASCNSFLSNRGYRVLRLWERDLHGDPGSCRNRIIQALQETSS